MIKCRDRLARLQQAGNEVVLSVPEACDICASTLDVRRLRNGGLICSTCRAALEESDAQK